MKNYYWIRSLQFFELISHPEDGWNHGHNKIFHYFFDIKWVNIIKMIFFYENKKNNYSKFSLFFSNFSSNKFLFNIFIR